MKKYQPVEYFLDTKQAAFWSLVPDKGYYWEERVKLFNGKRTEPPYRLKPPYLLVNQETSKYKHLKIEQEPTLFIKFAKLIEAKDVKKAILDFANSYGRLCYSDYTVQTPYFYFENENPPAWQVEMTPLKEDGRIYGLVEGESLSLWREQITAVSIAFKLWQWLNEKNIKELKKVIHWENNAVFFLVRNHSYFKVAFSSSLIAAEDYRRDIFNRFKRGDVLLPAKAMLQKLINKSFEKFSVQPRLLLNNQNELERCLYPTSLLSAIWLQLFEAVTGERKIKRCEICGKWEDVTDNRKWKSWKRHRACNSAKRAQVYRERVKKAVELERKELSPTEIAKQMNATEQQVKRWLTCTYAKSLRK